MAQARGGMTHRRPQRMGGVADRFNEPAGVSNSMSMTFYFAPMSTASVTEAVLAELRIDCERVQLDIDAGDTRKPEFLGINPNGRVPVFEHDGHIMWESAAITLYLGELFGVDAGLYPPSGPRRGQAMKWIVWANTTLAEAAGRLSEMLPPDQDGAVQAGSIDFNETKFHDPAALKRAEADLASCFSILNNALQSKSYLLGSYSLVDAHMFVLVGWAQMMGADLTACSNVAGWMNRCGARPSMAFLQDE